MLCDRAGGLDFWNYNYVLTFRTFTFFAGVDLGHTDFPAAVFAMKINDGRLPWHYYNAVASWALAPLTCVFVLNTDFVTTVFAVKLNCKIRLIHLPAFFAGLEIFTYSMAVL